MKIIFILLLAIIPLFGEQNRHILLLHSYHKGLAWSDNLSNGVEDVLKNHPNIQLTTEYMDTKKNEDKEYLANLYKLFESKLKNQEYDAIIGSDDFAIDFILEHKETLFKDIPIVFCGVEISAAGVDVELIKRYKIPLIYENKDIKTNMQHIKQILPNLEYLYIVSDKTKDSLPNNEAFTLFAKELQNSGLHVELYFGANLLEIEQKVKNMPSSSAVMLGTLLHDNNGKYIPYNEVQKLINSSTAPVFAVGDTFLGRGIVGGYLLRGYPVGVEAAKVTIKYMNDRTYIEPILAPSEWVFDYEVAKKYGLEIKDFPKGSKIINPPQTFFDKHRQIAENIIIAFPFILLSLVIALMYGYLKYKTNQKLTARSKWEKVLLDNIQSAVFWIDKEGIIKGCNEKFCQFVKKGLFYVLGKKVEDILPIATNAGEVEFDKKLYKIARREFSNDENEGVVFVITDITEKKELEIQTQLNIQQSKSAEVGEMLNAIVHQWKAPLVELSAVAHKVQHYHKKDKLTGKDIEEFYNIIMKQTIYMSETIDGFRDFLRPSNEASDFCLDSSLKDVMSLLSYSLEYHHIKLTYTKDSSHVVRGFENEFKQVIVNIINNSKDAILESREKNIPTKSLIRVVVHGDEKMVKLHIFDDGIGLTQSSSGKLFNPFFTTKTNGDGFGLYMAKLIVENKMNGSIELGMSGSETLTMITLKKKI